MLKDAIAKREAGEAEKKEKSSSSGADAEKHKVADEAAGEANVKKDVA